MTDELDSLEAELAGMRPRRLTPDLASRVAAPLFAPDERVWSDRILLAAIGSGAIAAIIIVGVLLGEPSSRSLPPRPTATIATTPAPRAPRAGDLSLTAARQNDQLASALK